MALKEKIMTNEQQQFAISTGKGNMGIVSPLSVTWPQLTARLSAPKIGSKEGSFWCPASFATNSRKLENVKAVALIVLDVEQKATTPPPLRDALMACSGLNWTAFAHTSYKHTVQSPRYRLILQPDRPIEPGQLRAVVTAVADRLGLSTCTDLAASCDAARLYFLPRVPHAAAKGLFECDGYEGTTVGLDSLTAPASHALMPVAPQAPADAGWDVGLLDAVEKAASGKPAPDRQRVVSDLRDALRYLSPDEYADWIAGGHDLYRLGADGEALWTEWSMRSPKWKPTDAAKWASFKDTHSDYPAIFKRAQQAGWRNPASSTRSTTTAREDFQLGMAEHAAPAPKPKRSNRWTKPLSPPRRPALREKLKPPAAEHSCAVQPARWQRASSLPKRRLRLLNWRLRTVFTSGACRANWALLSPSRQMQLRRAALT